MRTHLRPILTTSLLGLALLAAIASTARPAPTERQPGSLPPNGNTLTDAEKAAGWKLLFDGKTTGGWRNFKKQDVSKGWQVIDGALCRVDQSAGDIITTDQYDNFVLELDYKVPPHANSGIMVRVSEDEARAPFTGVECQILDNTDPKGDSQKSGWAYALYQPPLDPKTGRPLDATRPVGQWNHVKLVCNGPHVEHWMNGVKYCEYEIGSDDWNQRVAKAKFAKWPKFAAYKTGHVALQGDHGNVCFANVKLRPLAAPPAGQRVFSCGHSFHVFVPSIVADMAKAAGVKDHQQLGLSGIGGSRVIQHWDVPDATNKAKEALQSGKVDVLTLSPIHLPDDGIEKFAALALKHNPSARILVQEFWLPFDIYDTTFKLRPKKVDHNAPTGAELRKLHEPYFQSMDDHVRALNGKFGKEALFVVPVGQAVIALREKIIAGQAPGLKTQEDLFTDAVGHATPPLQALVAYCHFAVIYRRSPVGLPVPAVLAKAANPAENDKLNRLLQELAWDAVTNHPQSGVKKSP